MNEKSKAPEVLVVKHKHYNSHYVVASPQDVLRAKAQMVYEWKENGVFYEPDEPYIHEKDKEIGVLSDEQIADLPEAFQQAAKKARANILSAQRTFEDQKREFDLVNQILAAETVDEAIAIPGPDGRGTAVEAIVRAYGNQEYTEWEIESTQSLHTW